MLKMISTRDAFGQALVELGEENPDVIVFTADLATSTRTELFAAKFPDRFFDMGVAEQNMISVAAGAATCGKIPFISTLAVFACERALNQITVSVAYPKLNVKIVGTHGGISVGKDGTTHQSICDISIMRSIPNMVVIVPCDAIETKKCIKAAARYVGPVYIRLGREPLPVLFDESYDFHIGKAVEMKDGEDVAIVANGLMVHQSLRAHDLLLKKGIKAKVINLHTVKPIDEEMIEKVARETGALVTVEEHTIMGGLGGAVAEVLVEKYPVPMLRVGLRDVFGESGEPQDLLRKYGLLDIDIVDAVERVIKMKRK
jgi:transketolase